MTKLNLNSYQQETEKHCQLFARHEKLGNLNKQHQGAYITLVGKNKGFWIHEMPRKEMLVE